MHGQDSPTQVGNPYASEIRIGQRRKMIGLVLQCTFTTYIINERQLGK